MGLDDPRRVYGSYPHQLSGGMLQRVLIGLAVLPRPALLVADEPTSALDVTIQKRILDLLSELRADLGISLLLITHDLAIAAERADSLVVLRDGAVQEAGPTAAGVRRAPLRLRARAAGRRAGAQPGPLPRAAGERLRPGRRAAEPKIELRGVTKSFTVEGRRRTALDDVSFAVQPGTTHALVGESGSGKTTAVRLLLGLEQRRRAARSSSRGEPVHGRSAAGLRTVRRHLQLVYQNPFTSLDPTWRVERLVREPLDRFRIGDRARARRAGARGARRRRPGGAPPVAATRPPCPAGSGSAWRSPARWCCGPTSWCSTSRPRRST